LSLELTRSGLLTRAVDVTLADLFSSAVMYPPPFCVSDETLVYSKPRLMDIRYGDDE